MTDEPTAQPTGPEPSPDLPRYLQLLWDREPVGRRGPRPGRTIGEIGAAAVAIADANGLDAVSMKSVAAAIGLTPMSLYRYVDGKDELVAVMLDVAIGPPDDDRPGRGHRPRWGEGPAGAHGAAVARGAAGAQRASGGDWRDGLAAWVRGITARRLAHPWTVEVQLDAPPLSPNLMAWTEAGLAELAATPLTSHERFSALLALDGWAHHHVRQSLQMGFLGELDPDGPQASYGRNVAALVTADRFPRLSASQSELVAQDEDRFYEEEFEFGLAILLDGLAALIARRAAAG